MQVLFATNNRNKVREVQPLLPPEIKLITLEDAGFNVELPEPFETLEENAQSKIQSILLRTGIQVGFSEDSGLFIQALNGRPGVHSAQYAGPQRNDSDNIKKVLEEMHGQSDRHAYFQTTISLQAGSKIFFFTGTCPGIIVEHPAGNHGFGYDPIFQPDGAKFTFAQMSLEEKNRFSHRKKAVNQLVDFFHQTKIFF